MLGQSFVIYTYSGDENSLHSTSEVQQLPPYCVDIDSSVAFLPARVRIHDVRWYTCDIDGDGCGPSSTDLKQLSEEEALKTYFAKGYTNAQLCTVLQHAHGIDLTLDQVKKRLAKLGLRRRGPGTQPPLQDAIKVRREYHVKLVSAIHF